MLIVFLRNHHEVVHLLYQLRKMFPLNAFPELVDEHMYTCFNLSFKGAFLAPYFLFLFLIDKGLERKKQLNKHFSSFSLCSLPDFHSHLSFYEIDMSDQNVFYFFIYRCVFILFACLSSWLLSIFTFFSLLVDLPFHSWNAHRILREYDCIRRKNEDLECEVKMLRQELARAHLFAEECHNEARSSREECLGLRENVWVLLPNLSSFSSFSSLFWTDSKIYSV